jgi:hypothetical protein
MNGFYIYPRILPLILVLYYGRSIPTGAAEHNLKQGGDAVLNRLLTPEHYLRSENSRPCMADSITNVAIAQGKAAYTTDTSSRTLQTLAIAGFDMRCSNTSCVSMSGNVSYPDPKS